MTQGCCSLADLVANWRSAQLQDTPAIEPAAAAPSACPRWHLFGSGKHEEEACVCVGFPALRLAGGRLHPGSLAGVLQVSCTLAGHLLRLHNEPHSYVLGMLSPQHVLSDGTLELDALSCCKKVRRHAEAPAVQQIVETTDPHSIAYCAPELVKGLPYSTAADVYSLAMIISELLNLEPPYAEISDMEEFLARAVHGKLRPHLHFSVPSPLRDLLRRCWNPQSYNRPELDVVLSHLTYLSIECERQGSSTINNSAPTLTSSSAQYGSISAAASDQLALSQEESCTNSCTRTVALSASRSSSHNKNHSQQHQKQQQRTPSPSQSQPRTRPSRTFSHAQSPEKIMVPQEALLLDEQQQRMMAEHLQLNAALIQAGLLMAEQPRRLKEEPYSANSSSSTCAANAAASGVKARAAASAMLSRVCFWRKKDKKRAVCNPADRVVFP